MKCAIGAGVCKARCTFSTITSISMPSGRAWKARIDERGAGKNRLATMNFLALPPVGSCGRGLRPCDCAAQAKPARRRLRLRKAWFSRRCGRRTSPRHGSSASISRGSVEDRPPRCDIAGNARSVQVSVEPRPDRNTHHKPEHHEQALPALPPATRARCRFPVPASATRWCASPPEIS